MNDRSLLRHLIIIILVKMAVLMGIWAVFMKPYTVQPSAAELARAVLGSNLQEGETHAAH